MSKSISRKVAYYGLLICAGALSSLLIRGVSGEPTIEVAGLAPAALEESDLRPGLGAERLVFVAESRAARRDYALPLTTSTPLTR